MFQATIRNTMLAVSAVGLIGLSSGQAQAEHVNYCFQGECYGFESETHMVHSLEYMEKAYQFRRTPRLSRFYAYQALNELRLANREVESRRAEHYLDFGQDHLRKFMLTGRIGELDHAADHVADAIRAEQRFQRRHVHDHHDHHGHHGHAGLGRGRPNVPPGRPAWVRPPQQGGSFQVGGNWGGLRIRF